MDTQLVFVALGWLEQSEDYTKWVEERGNILYRNSLFMEATSLEEEQGTAVIHWSITSSHLLLAIAVPIGSSVPSSINVTVEEDEAGQSGWVGFGFSENGGMRGADIVLYETDRPNELKDTHVLDELVTPIADDCQNWSLLHVQNSKGILIVEGMRLLNTNDTQDRPIQDDSSFEVAPTFVIAAWGSSSTAIYHGSNRAKSTARLFGRVGSQQAAFDRVMQVESSGEFTLRASNFRIPNRKTTYRRFCLLGADLLAQGVPLDEPLHIIGIEPVIYQETEQHVHHFILNAGQDGGGCGGFLTRLDVIYGWAPGVQSLVLPDDVGIPLGGSDGYSAFNLQIHYDVPNPDAEKVMIDNSGIRIFWTRELRQFDTGMLQLGDPFTRRRGQAIDIGVSQHTFGCPADCTSILMSDSITVLAESFHMHQIGIRTTNSVRRDNEVVHEAIVDYWDFEQAGMVTVQQDPYELLPGDEFETNCYYESSGGTVFGLDSDDEMCIVYIMYYPRQTYFGLPLICTQAPQLDCSPTYKKQVLGGIDEVQRQFGMMSNGSEGQGCLDPSDSVMTTAPTPSPAPICAKPLESCSSNEDCCSGRCSPVFGCRLDPNTGSRSKGDRSIAPPTVGGQGGRWKRQS